jgi:hypothetical protein
MKTYVVAGALLLASMFAALPAAAQESTSAPLVAELSRLLDQQKLDSVAVKDPDEPDRFIAASYLPGVQMIVVSGKFPVPAALEAMLGDRRYAEVYANLNSTQIKEGKLFIQDVRADGLYPTRRGDGAFDIVYENVTTTTMFDGDYRKQKVSRNEYQSHFKTVDGNYARMLTLLIAELKKGE